MATRKVFCSYQEIIDLHTESDKVTAIGFHVPDTDTPHKFFGGLYDQFKKVKYLGMSVSFVPVARLPVDPLGVSYEAGDLTMDPRDVVNPILVHGCHGNDMGAILNQLYAIGHGSDVLGTEGDTLETDSTVLAQFINQNEGSGEFTILENLYYKALVDNTWQKAHPQKGFRKSGLHPMVYNVVANHQINPSLAMQGPQDAIKYPYGVDAGVEVHAGQQGSAIYSLNSHPSETRLFTNRLVPMGWMDTRNVVSTSQSVRVMPGTTRTYNNILAELLDNSTVLSKFERVYMMVCLLPPAYKTEQYFRCIINHNFVFAGFRGISFNNSDADLMPPSVFDINEEMSGLVSAPNTVMLNLSVSPGNSAITFYKNGSYNTMKNVPADGLVSIELDPSASWSIGRTAMEQSTKHFELDSDEYIGFSDVSIDASTTRINLTFETGATEAFLSFSIVNNS